MSSENFIQRVEEPTKEACTLFIKKFQAAYKDALFVQAKIDSGIAEKVVKELCPSPRHTYILKRGKLYKRGDNVMSLYQNYMIIFKNI